MCITNPSKISDFRENLLHMLLFWTLILFDSYAYSYKNRGCRMCNSPFFVCGLTSFGFDHNFDHNANDFIWSNSCRSVQFSGRKRLAEQLNRTLPNGFLNMEIMLSHLGVGVSYDV